MNLRGTNHQIVKQRNRLLILKLIYERGSITRQEIARITTLTPATVTNITGELLEEGFIRELPAYEEKTGVGRKAIPLVINSSSAYVIAIDVGPKIIRIALSGLVGHLSNVESYNYEPREPEKLISILCEKVSSLIEGRRILGIGMGVPVS